MKSFREVEATRRQNHSDPNRNSVHRSSLLVPMLEGAEAEISFLNHFLIKRGHPRVGCRVTGIGPDGARVGASLEVLTEPRVHTLRLAELFDSPLSSCHVEFFSADNLVIPFPAVMMNHAGEGFFNQVHAYNRVLNDVFEEDALLSKHVAETSLDLEVGEDRDTFIAFMAGPRPVDAPVTVTAVTPGASRSVEVPLALPRLTTKRLGLRALMPDLPPTRCGLLRVEVPRQEMFFGRLLSGVVTNDGSFSANHSYYDASGVAEYWENAEASHRTFAYLPGFTNRLRFSPTMSPGRYGLDVALRGHAGEVLRRVDVGELESPGRGILEVVVDALVADAGLSHEAVSAFTARVTPREGHLTPTRINHQLLYGAGGLEGSISIGLMNRNVFRAPGARSFIWGQAVAGGGLNSRIGLSTDDVTGADGDFSVALSLYGATGLLLARPLTLACRAGCALDVGALLAEAAPGLELSVRQPIWFTAVSQRPGLSGVIVTRAERTGHCSAEHSF